MDMTEQLRIGITMRVTEATGYNEKRDSLAQDWPVFMSRAFPEAVWLYIPNLGKDVIDYAEKWQLNAFIFSGGDDIGKTPVRDVTETNLYQYAQQNNFPVLGICRGMQVVFTFLGGKVEQGNKDFSLAHTATKHFVNVQGATHQVNSYHQNYLVKETMPDGIQILATCSTDQTIEAISANMFLGIMWHPEREMDAMPWSEVWIKKLFRKENV